MDGVQRKYWREVWGYENRGYKGVTQQKLHKEQKLVTKKKKYESSKLTRI
jgi:hypothetical protein